MDTHATRKRLGDTMLDKLVDELKRVINKLKIIIALCLLLSILIYFTPLKNIFNAKIEEKVEEFKKETKQKIESKKKEVENKLNNNIKEVEDKVESNIEKVEDKIKDLKKLKLKDIIK